MVKHLERHGVKRIPEPSEFIKSDDLHWALSPDFTLDVFFPADDQDAPDSWLARITKCSCCDALQYSLSAVFIRKKDGFHQYRLLDLDLMEVEDHPDPVIRNREWINLDEMKSYVSLRRQEVRTDFKNWQKTRKPA